MTVKLQNESLAHYQLLEPLGNGALGELFRARDTRHGRSVAIRIVSQAVASDADARRQLLDAAARAAALSHPSLGAMYEAGEADGRLYVAAEYVPGEPLGRVVSGLPLHPKRALEIAVQIADALAELHAADLVHGDVQPATIRITPKGQAKLLDAGLTRWTGSGRLRSDAPALIDGESRAGGETLAWMSPEQALGERIDHRSDLFSLGSVLYLMLTGTAPFSGATAGATILNVLQVTPPSARAKQADLPAGLDEVLKRALSKSLEGRCQSAASLSADLRAILDTKWGREDAQEDPGERKIVPTPFAQSAEPAPRSRVWQLVVLLLVAGAVAAWYLMR